MVGIVYAQREAILSSQIFILAADPCRGLPDTTLRKIRPTRIKRFLLLVEDIGVDSELLQMFLTLLVAFFPV